MTRVPSSWPTSPSERPRSLIVPAGSSRVVQLSHGLRRERVLASPQFDGTSFRNTHGATPDLTGPRWPLLREFFFGKNERVPSRPLPVERPHDTWARSIDSGLRVTWLGHSTVLLEIDGVRVLTDPVFGARVSPVSFTGPRRFHAVPAELEELPPLDVVLLSHDHYDHLCRTTMERLRHSDVPIVTSLGVGARLERMGIDPSRITELDWLESVDVRGLRLTATPAQHFSGRGLNDRNQTLWSSWVLQTDRHKVFFSGDTGLTDEFEVIGKKYGPFDLVLLEIGAFHDAWGCIHLGPHNALRAFRMLGGETLLPVHWGTFNLALHAWNEPAETLLQEAAAQAVRVLVPRPGQVFEPAQQDNAAPWWRL